MQKSFNTDGALVRHTVLILNRSAGFAFFVTSFRSWRTTSEAIAELISRKSLTSVTLQRIQNPPGFEQSHPATSRCEAEYSLVT
ncbi:hypothetical protein Ocin01_19038 [Orchesella cincta]|uniref:Uncharacterized protein n=1 Tax=Orchesella cincta TaxID=48709 RepID=A0A1D2M3U2_ORCCI|nr:hypothetical protein Ocin01_19038 [Orchesella cincta]